jgi:hypothetical protein
MDELERSTPTKRILLAAVTLLLLSIPLKANANLIWDWTGDCQRAQYDAPPLCTHASARIVTTDQVIPGEVFVPTTPQFSNSTLLEFLYADDYVKRDDLAVYWRLDAQALQLPASSSEGGFVSTFSLNFRSDASGIWEINGEGLNTPPYCGELHNHFCGYQVFGIHGVWTRVPAPSTLVLLGVGFAALVFCSRRWLG